MKIETVKEYTNTKFRRITGIKRATFELMVKILGVAYAFKHEKGGRKPKLPVEEMLLAAIEYWREYRSYAHIGASYGIDESNIYRAIKWVEDTLIKRGKFSLPGKKALKKEVKKYKVVLIDATENPIERPKKNRDSIIPVSKNVIR
jgi:hypothetical protein